MCEAAYRLMCESAGLQAHVDELSELLPKLSPAFRDVAYELLRAGGFHAVRTSGGAASGLNGGVELRIVLEPSQALFGLLAVARELHRQFLAEYDGDAG